MAGDGDQWMCARLLNAIFYVLTTGCQWKALPEGFATEEHSAFYLMLWDWDGTLERINDTLYVAFAKRLGREASPTVAIIDSRAPRHLKKGLCD